MYCTRDRKNIAVLSTFLVGLAQTHQIIDTLVDPFPLPCISTSTKLHVALATKLGCQFLWHKAHV